MFSQQPREQQEKQENQLFPLGFAGVAGVCGCDSCFVCFFEVCLSSTTFTETFPAPFVSNLKMKQKCVSFKKTLADGKQETWVT